MREIQRYNIHVIRIPEAAERKERKKYLKYFQAENFEVIGLCCEDNTRGNEEVQENVSTVQEEISWRI